jgi:D-alanine transaminase
LAQRNDFKLEVRPVPVAEMWKADEMWLSSSSKGVLAITSLDDKPVGNGLNVGKPGPMFRRMFTAMQADMHS